MDCWRRFRHNLVTLKWAIPLIGIALFIILTISKQLTILNLGESLAKGLGQNVTMIRGICLIIAMILAGIAVAIAGQVAFVGLMVPHIARFLIGTDYAKFYRLTALLVGYSCLLLDVIARYLGEALLAQSFHLSVFPYFLYLVKKGGTLNMISSNNKRRQLIALAVFSILLFLGCTWSITSGEYNIPVERFFKTLIGQGDAIDELILLDFRLPRMMITILAGAAA